jgi:predicted phosphodiesterase
MKFAVISDIHGNATAFRQVLKDIEDSGLSTIYCLGDNIGYGPEPEAVLQIIRERGILSVLGNHELAVKHPEFLNRFNPIARISLEKTRSLLSETSIKQIEAMGRFYVKNNCRFVHGFPPDSPITYLFEVEKDKLISTIKISREAVCFVGHTHEPVLISYDGNEICRRPLKQETVFIDTGFACIVNVGSVGQPRDGNNSAKYVIFDDQTFELEVRFISYDVNDTVNKIYQAGLPEQHAWRLF